MQLVERFMERIFFNTASTNRRTGSKGNMEQEVKIGVKNIRDLRHSILVITLNVCGLNALVKIKTNC